MNPEFLWLYSNLEDIIDMEFIVTTKEEEKINDRDYTDTSFQDVPNKIGM